jgi:hypothetical protein
MADWSFEKAHTWEDLTSAHDKWMKDYNFQKHMAHEQRDDGCHSPAAVLGWITGMQPEPELVHRVFEAICETRRLNKAGYVRFRNFLLYGERGLVGQEALVNIFQDMLTLEHNEEKLSRYAVQWQPDDRHLARVGNPRLYQHSYHSPQLDRLRNQAKWSGLSSSARVHRCVDANAHAAWCWCSHHCLMNQPEHEAAADQPSPCLALSTVKEQLLLSHPEERSRAHE